ncbi:MAG: ABC transporter ATP-binding protein [bacterium]
MIELRRVSRKYVLGGETIKALDGIDLVIPDKTFMAIMGPSGSGKTTFLNLIGGLDRPDTGKVIVDGQDLSRLKDQQLSKFRNKDIGFVFQAFHLQPFYSAEENVMLPLLFSKVKPKERKKRARDVLKLVDLEQRMKHRPSELSAGQRQRVSIARAIVTEPNIILADEPTGNLDSKSGQTIMRLLRDLLKTRGITIVMVTHNAEMAKMADQVVNILDGKIKS